VFALLPPFALLDSLAARCSSWQSTGGAEVVAAAASNDSASGLRDTAWREIMLSNVFDVYFI
jgi:hypothetical protein